MLICIVQSALKFIRTLYMAFPGSDSEIPGSLIPQQSTSKAAAIILELQLI